MSNKTQVQKKKKSPRSTKLTQKDFLIESLGKSVFPTPLTFLDRFIGSSKDRVFFNNIIRENEKICAEEIFTLEMPGPAKKIFFDSSKINVGIVTCGGLCPGLNDVIRSITYNALDKYHVKNVYGFRYGFEGLTTDHCHSAIRLTPETIDNIHGEGGTILGTSRGDQPIEDIVDTLVKFNISILFVVGGDGTQHGTMCIAEEIKRRKLLISVIGIPKTIDNDISYIHKTFGFDTAVEEARKAIDRAHVEAKGARNGIGVVKLMGRFSGFIATHATLASGNVNICLIPEAPFSLEEFLNKIKTRLETKNHLVVVVAEGVGQDILYKDSPEEYDKSGNLKLKDIGPFLCEEISKFLKKENILHSIKYIDPSYMIRATPASAIDSSFCLRLGNYAVHAGMAGKTNALVGYWNQHFCLVPIKLALTRRKMVDINDATWQAVLEITEPNQKME